MKRERKASSVTTKQPNPKQSRLDTWAKKDTNMTQAGKSDPIVKSEEDDTLPSKKVKKTKELTLYGGGTIRFWPKFMAHKEAEELFQELNKSCEFTQSDVKVFNKVHKTPRLQAWMADENTDASLYTSSSPTPWTESMLELRKKLEKLLDCEFDYCLLNLYRDGRDYIAFHSDNEAIGDDRNIIASISLGASRRFVLQKKDDKKDKHEFILNSGSLIVMSGTLQQFWKHGIPKMLKVKEPRLNLTFRQSDRVPK